MQVRSSLDEEMRERVARQEAAEQRLSDVLEKLAAHEQATRVSMQVGAAGARPALGA